MKKQITQFTLGVVAATSFSHAGAEVLTFDDLQTFPKTPPAVGSAGSFFDDATLITDFSYQGFRFANENGNRWFWNPETNASGEPYSGVGGSIWLGVDTTGNPTGTSDNFAPAITSVVDFIFDGAYFTGYDPIRYKLYLNGDLKQTTTQCVLPATQTPVFCASGYSGLVDKVVIENLTFPGVDPGVYFAMDDFTYTAAPIPEPSTYALMAGGLAALAMASRRRKKAA